MASPSTSAPRQATTATPSERRAPTTSRAQPSRPSRSAPSGSHGPGVRVERRDQPAADEEAERHRPRAIFGEAALQPIDDAQRIDERPQVPAALGIDECAAASAAPARGRGTASPDRWWRATARRSRRRAMSARTHEASARREAASAARPAGRAGRWPGSRRRLPDAAADPATTPGRRRAWSRAARNAAAAAPQPAASGTSRVASASNIRRPRPGQAVTSSTASDPLSSVPAASPSTEATGDAVGRHSARHSQRPRPTPRALAASTCRAAVPSATAACWIRSSDAASGRPSASTGTIR